MNIERFSELGQMGQSTLGYSMMAGLGGGPTGKLMAMAYDAMGMAGIGPGAPTGPSLYERVQLPDGGYGVYSAGELEMRDIASARHATQYQYTMGLGEWATQTMTPFNYQMQRIKVDAQGKPVTIQEGPQKGQYVWESYQATAGAETFQFGLTGELENMREGFGVWQQQRALDRDIREARYSQQYRSAEFAGRSLEMQKRHALESLAMQQELWGTNVAFQRQEMGFQWEQMQTTQGWQRQEFALNRQQAGMQFEFQAGELEYGIRSSGGRQRAALMRQREYAEEQFSFSEMRRGRQESQWEEQAEWQEEAFIRQREHFEEITQLQQEQFEMQRQHILERYALEKEKLDAQIASMGHIKQLEDKRRQITEEWEEKQKKREIAKVERQTAYEQKMEQYYQWEWSVQEDIRENHAKYLEWQLKGINKLGESMTEMVNAIILELERTIPGFDLPSLMAKYKGVDTDVDAAEMKPLPEFKIEMADVKLIVGDREMDAEIEYVLDVNRESGSRNWERYTR
jgi:hypothetical protein